MNKIKELLETSGYWIFAIIAMVVFYFGQSNQDNKNHDIEMAKAGLHQQIDPQTHQIFWTK